MKQSTFIALAALSATAVPARAQTAPATTPPAPAAGAAAPAPTVAVAPATPRASWLSDRQPLRVGDLVTIVVDEQTRAREQTSTIATGNRSLDASLNAGIANKIGPSKGFGTGLNSSSRDVGDAMHNGDFTSTLAVHVVEIDPMGNAKIQGTKLVTVDGRKQELAISGMIRPDDVNSDNQVSSDRVADAVISYKGKQIAPKKGILGKILSILWP